MTDAIRSAGAAPLPLPRLRREIAPLDDLIAFCRLWRFFRQWRPDVVHTHMAKAGALGRLAAALAAVPVRVHSYHGHVFHGYFGRVGSFATRVTERVLGRMTSGIVTLTPAQQDEIVGQLRIVPAARASMIPYGCEISERSASDELKASWRRRLGIADDAFVALSVGRLVAIKNHDLLLRALASCTHCPHITAVIVGDGELRQELERQAAELGVAQRVVFAGWRDDVDVAYQAADVLTLTSRNEGSPLAVMESMASGCPVIATRVGGVPDLLDESSGILVDDNDATALAAAMCVLARDPHRVARMGAAALARARAEFSVDREAGSMLAYYQQLLRSRGGYHAEQSK
jgi:glycosyltransferase involved in cell wall biosynthesis